MASKRIHLVWRPNGRGILAGAGLRAQSRVTTTMKMRGKSCEGLVVGYPVNEGGLTLKVLDPFSLGEV